jgi:DNA-binding CsgD family transcriptional regulator
MRTEDVDECASIIATHPVLGPRYGSKIAYLRPAWIRLLKSEAGDAWVLEEISGPRATICFVGVSVVVHDDFVRELKAPALRWIGPELTMRIVGGDSPLLSGKQLREANSCGGLNLVTWEGCIRPGYERYGEIHRKLLELFLEVHSGYRWNEAIAASMESVERLKWTIETGGRLWGPEAQRYLESSERDPREIIAKPHIVGVTREMESGRHGSWVGSLFDYHPPRIGLSPSEQRLLLLALSGSTDDELADELGSSLSTIKNTWRSIFNRAASHVPELFSKCERDYLNISARGKEKRRPLLAYVREHPEELRPVSKKLLRQASAPRGQSTE